MRRIPLIILLGLIIGSSLAQQAPDTKTAPGAKASKLEAQLSKLRSTAPEAAKIMIELIDLYHAEGRVFGLIRVGDNFVRLHSAHPRHREMMLKLLDGLFAASRTQSAIATARQFLVRYPKAKECGQIETELAAILDRASDRGAAAAYEAVWRRQGNSAAGRRAGVRAMVLFAAQNNKLSYARAGQLADDMVAKLAQGEFATEVGMRGVAYWEAAGEYAKANLLGNQLLQKSMPTDKPRREQLLRRLGENDARIGQRSNAADSFRKALALDASPELHFRLIQELHNGAAKPNVLEPVVNDYVKKYPQRQDRFVARTYLAHSYLREKNTARALQILAEVMPHDARTASNATVYVQTNGTEPAKLAQSENVLRNALKTNERDATPLRYALAFNVYRDGLKDPNRARQTVRELISSPSNESLTQSAMHWLLYNEESEAAFKADIVRILAARKAHYDWTAHRNYLQAWIDAAAKTKEHAVRAGWARGELKKANQDPLYGLWVSATGANAKQARNARATLLGPAHFNKLPDDQARYLLEQQASSYRNDSAANQRPKSVSVYGQLVRRFPKDYRAAVWYLQAATDYGPKEVAKEAALNLLKLTPEFNDGDVARRLVIAADNNKDTALLKQASAWITKSHEKFGFAPQYAYQIGDVYDKYDLKQAALDYWRKGMEAERDSYESRACAERLLIRAKGPARTALLQSLLKEDSNYLGLYAFWLADDQLTAGNVAAFDKTLRAALARQQQRPLRGWGVEEAYVLNVLGRVRADMKAADKDKLTVFEVIRDMRVGRASAAAALSILELPTEKPLAPMARLLAYRDATLLAGTSSNDWDTLLAHVQTAMARKDYEAASTLTSAMLANLTGINAPRRQAGLDLVRRCYARMGSLGTNIDENSPIAPLLQAALYLRLGDEDLAFDVYAKNIDLFDKNRSAMPVELIEFVCARHIAAGGDDNFDRVEKTLRGWLVKNSEAKEIDETAKARIQLLLARSYFKARRYDVARGEFTTTINRYPDSPQALEAEFGIGETYLAQKVFDQAQAVFEKLAGSRDRDIVIRAEFLRGVLASRRGDRDEAREIFRGVLERVPDIELANQALFGLSEVYGAEQRYIDQLELLQTIGRLGRHSKRFHTPGRMLSIVVQDSDLGISRGHAKIPVRVITAPGGDEELIYLRSGGAGKGLFRADLETRLGPVTKGDKVLQLTGRDVIRCDYPEEFKKEFRNVPLADAEIRIAANAKLEVASSRIVDLKEETLSERLEREAREQAESDSRLSSNRPINQIKPGNIIYIRVKDADRDASDEPNKVSVKFEAASGDQVTVPLLETGAHTGVFEGTLKTGELPAGALASDSSIDHGPLMAIDRDNRTSWLSQPDGATPKWISVDMKDLKVVDRVRISTPDPSQHAPVRAVVEGSNDGRFWFRIAGNPALPGAEPVTGDFKTMTRRVYPGNFNNYTTWDQIVALSKNSKPINQQEVTDVSWQLSEEELQKPKQATKPYGVLWSGKLVQRRAGAARIQVQGTRSALVIDGRLELEVGPGGRGVDVWLDQGIHDLTIFATGTGAGGVGATWARADNNASQIVLGAFKEEDFDVEQAGVKPVVRRKPPKLLERPGSWEFRFEPHEIRHLRLVVHEYRGEAVAVSNIEIASFAEKKSYIPTEADVLSLATNNILEIAGGDVVTASYVDEVTETATLAARLLTAELTATYFNGTVAPVSFEIVQQPNGAVARVRKQLMRIDPGERIVFEITDYDQDRSDKPDTVRIQVAVNDGEPVTMTAQESGDNTGVFTKEVETSAKTEEGKLTVKQGDRVYCRYLDEQNTFPGHGVPREARVYVNEPTEGRVRVVDTRFVRPPAGSDAAPRMQYLFSGPKRATAQIGFEVPLTVEVYDKDAAKDSRSTVTVKLLTTDGATVDVVCAISAFQLAGADALTALEEGRFIGQVILQLGSKNSPVLVPLTADMPRTLIGGPKLSKEDAAQGSLVTRVLNLTGKDIIKATYEDERRPDKAQSLEAQARLIAAGTFAATDAEYKTPVTSLHVGENLYLQVVDPDLDQSDERDSARVRIKSARGEEETVELLETLAHSGVFTGSVTLKVNDKPQAGNLDPQKPIIECYFGDTLELQYVDQAAGTETGTLTVELKLPVVVGTDGLVAAFSKTFNDEKLAVETQFRIAESYFELFKSHKTLERTEEQKADLEKGRRILRDVMKDYPNPKYVPRVAYLLGQFAQELGEWNEAIESYQMIVRQYPDHTLAPDAHYKLAQCYEESEEFEKALEAYVTLAATYPKSPLIADVMIRISEHFHKQENYQVAAQVGEKFLERFKDHKYAAKMGFRVGQAYHKDKQFNKAGAAFDRFVETYKNDELAPQALFWSAESYRMVKNYRNAFVRYYRCHLDYPASEAAKYSRGRLQLQEIQNASIVNDNP